MTWEFGVTKVFLEMKKHPKKYFFNFLDASKIIVFLINDQALSNLLS